MFNLNSLFGKNNQPNNPQQNKPQQPKKTFTEKAAEAAAKRVLDKADAAVEKKLKQLKPGEIFLIEKDILLKCIDNTATEIIIPDNVKRIFLHAFVDFPNLTSITLPAGLEAIDSDAFVNCYNLRKVTLPENLQSLQKDSFVGTRPKMYVKSDSHVAWLADLKDYHIEEIITPLFELEQQESDVIPSEHYNTTNTAINNTDTVNIANNTNNTINNTDAINSANTANDLNAITFGGTTQPQTLSSQPAEQQPNQLPEDDQLYKIESGVLVECLDPSIEEAKILHDKGITIIGGAAFKDCKNLTKVSIPNTVKEIGTHAFFECSNLTHISIPNSVIKIGYYAFAHCRSLKSIVIPDSVEEIGDYAFTDCESLENIILPNGLKKLGGLAFSYCSSLTSIVIPNGISTIQDNTFMDCKNLSNIELPDSIKTISDYAFEGCTNLSEITIPVNVTKLSKFIFSGCRNLKKITVLNSVVEIGDCAFFSSIAMELGDSPLKTICGTPGSTAEEFAKKYNIEFVSISSDQAGSRPQPTSRPVAQSTQTTHRRTITRR